MYQLTGQRVIDVFEFRIEKRRYLFQMHECLILNEKVIFYKNKIPHTKKNRESLPIILSTHIKGNTALRYEGGFIFPATRACYRASRRGCTSYIPADYFCWPGISLGSDVRLGLRIFMAGVSFSLVLFLSPSLGPVYKRALMDGSKRGYANLCSRRLSSSKLQEYWYQDRILVPKLDRDESAGIFATLSTNRPACRFSILIRCLK